MAAMLQSLLADTKPFIEGGEINQEFLPPALATYLLLVQETEKL